MSKMRMLCNGEGKGICKVSILLQKGGGDLHVERLVVSCVTRIASFPSCMT